MNNFSLNNLTEIRDFCLSNLNDGYQKISFLDNTYVSSSSRVFVFNLLMSNKILNLIASDDYINYSDKYIDELRKSTPTSLSIELRHEIWNFITPIYKKLKEYSAINFKPNDLYLRITNLLRKTGAHSWTAYIRPITEKFWVEGDFTFSEFLERLSENITKDDKIKEEWWDFHQNKKPVISEQ